MPKKIQLSIPVPCHENWNAMTPVDTGKFCGSCQKQVVDFSTMSDRQVAEFFKKPSTGSVCGRFMTDQLDREMEIPRKRIPWLKYFFTIALPAFFMSTRASAERTQGKIRLNTEVKQKPGRKTMGAPVAVKCENLVTGDTTQMISTFLPAISNKLQKDQKDFVGSSDHPLMKEAKNRPVEILHPELLTGVVGGIMITRTDRLAELRGRVADEKGNPIPNASVCQKGTKTATVSDDKGFFSFRVNKNEKVIRLVVSCVGFNSHEKEITPSIMSSEILFTLTTPENWLLGEVVVAAGKPLSKTKEMKTIPIIPQMPADTAKTSFRLYPNPFPSGSALTIECRETEEGYYTLQLINAGGQSVHQQELWVDKEARLLSIAIPELKAGSYFLVLTRQESGKRFTEKIIIQ